VNINDSRVNNKMSIKSVEKWLDINPNELARFYEELMENAELLSDISQSIEKCSDYKENLPGLFKNIPITNVDWYGLQRILIYCLVRHLQPKVVLETGVYYGGNSVFILAALKRNGSGKLISIDFPQNRMTQKSLSARHPWVGDSELYSAKYDPGFIIPQRFRNDWELIIGDSLEILPSLSDPIDFFIHDSEHTLEHVSSELRYVWEKISDKGLVFVDDIDWSNAFYAFATSMQLYPLLLTDNGKDNLRIRTGLVQKMHRYNSSAQITKL
jgi:predicted O-methyltransferase YrrM